MRQIALWTTTCIFATAAWSEPQGRDLGCAHLYTLSLAALCRAELPELAQERKGDFLAHLLGLEGTPQETVIQIVAGEALRRGTCGALPSSQNPFRGELGIWTKAAHRSPLLRLQACSRQAPEGLFAEASNALCTCLGIEGEEVGASPDESDES